MGDKVGLLFLKTVFFPMFINFYSYKCLHLFLNVKTGN